MIVTTCAPKKTRTFPNRMLLSCFFLFLFSPTTFAFLLPQSPLLSHSALLHMSLHLLLLLLPLFALLLTGHMTTQKQSQKHR